LRDKIIQSAEEQIRRYGLRRFTIDDIASTLGISKKTVYKYFESKKQMISAVVEKHLEMEKHRTLEALETKGGWLDKLNSVISCNTEEQVPADLLEELQRFFPEEWNKKEIISEFKREQVRELLAQGVKDGNVRTDIHPSVIGLTIEKTIDAIFDYKFLKQHEITVNQAMEDIKKVVLYGILKRE